MPGVSPISCGLPWQERVHFKGMKTRLLPFMVLLLAMALEGGWPGHAQTGGPRTGEVMKLKLDHTPSLPDADRRYDRFRCGGRESKFLAAANRATARFGPGIPLRPLVLKGKFHV